MKTVIGIATVCMALTAMNALGSHGPRHNRAVSPDATAYTPLTLSCTVDGFVGQEEVGYRWEPGNPGKKRLDLKAVQYHISDHAIIPITRTSNNVYIGLETYPTKPDAKGGIDYGWKEATNNDGIKDNKWHPLDASMTGEASTGTGFARIFVKFTFDVSGGSDPSCRATKDVNAPG